MKTKGHTLLEVMAAALILAMLGSSIAALFMMYGGMLSVGQHKVEAMNYANALAEILSTQKSLENDKEWLWPAGTKTDPLWLALSEGEHNKTTDPDFCTLPASYFTGKLKGELKYVVEKVNLGDPTYGPWGMRTAITVTWEEQFPKVKAQKMDLVIIAFYYYWTDAM